jgi:hypothetical protein
MGSVAYDDGRVMLQKLLIILIVAFVLFYLVTAPVQLANDVQGVASFLEDAANSLVRFFRALGG